MSNDDLISAPRRLRRDSDGGILGGVASGLAAYLSVDVAVIRLGFVILGLAGGAAVPLYAAAWLLLPDERDVSIATELLQQLRQA